MGKDWYIWLDGIKVFVTEEVYRTYKRAEWREEKQREAQTNREVSFELLSEKDADGQTVHNQALVDEIVTNELLLNTLRVILADLSDDEMMLINALYIHEKSERELSDATGIPQTTINYRKNKLLKKLRNKLKNF